MANAYRKKVGGMCKRTTVDDRVMHVQVQNFSRTERRQIVTRIDYGFRLECGHVVMGVNLAGRKAMNCYYCQWIDEGVHAAEEFEQKGWIDLPEGEGIPE